MIGFLLKGLLRDRHRSLFPVIVVAAGVALTTLLYSYLLGVTGDVLRNNAVFDAGHLKITTRAYAEIADQLPNDLGLINVNELLKELSAKYPDLIWTSRIKYGGLLDFPDENGETRSQGPVFGLGIDLFNDNSGEIERLNLDKAVISGRLPQRSGEIVLSDQLAQNLQAEIGDVATLISSNSFAGMAIQNFTVVGTVCFGTAALDHNTMLADVSDISYLLEMQDGAGEVLGFFNNGIYNDTEAVRIKQSFNAEYSNPDNETSPVMKTLLEQNNLSNYFDYIGRFSFILIFIFVGVMVIVLWNAGLLSGIRRYGEIGVRLAIGESKGGVYVSMLIESFLTAIIGSVIGVAIGLAASYYLQEVGFDLTRMMKGSSILMSSVIRARVTLTSYYIGFIPGIIATLLGTMISGVGIFKRQTSQLFRELET
ncbi:MAG: ABC transporter permease [Calditrichaeota bacterium]|nr:ABC transporter permease [Calditrichota bacterium]